MSPVKDNFNLYNDPTFIKNTIANISLDELLETFKSVGVYSKKIGNLVIIQ